MSSKKKMANEKEFDSLLRSLGFQFPKTELELNSFNKLFSNFKHSLKIDPSTPERIINEVQKEGADESQNSGDSKSKLFFKRVTLAGEIASQLHMEPTFGHIKFQKILYLCEQACSIEITDRYLKKAAGPYDNRFMHSIDKEFKRQGWFNVSREGTGSYKRYVYHPLDSVQKYKQYYNGYFSEYDHQIQYLITALKTQNTSFVEIVATLYFCWHEIIINDEEYSDNLVIERFYNWAREKLRFDSTYVLRVLIWMKENEITPLSLPSF